jgi:hypothetical protein
VAATAGGHAVASEHAEKLENTKCREIKINKQRNPPTASHVSSFRSGCEGSKDSSGEGATAVFEIPETGPQSQPQA